MESEDGHLQLTDLEVFTESIMNGKINQLVLNETKTDAPLT